MMEETTVGLEVQVIELQGFEIGEVNGGAFCAWWRAGVESDGAKFEEREVGGGSKD